MGAIGLAVVGVLRYRLLRSAASGVVELDVAAGLFCSVVEERIGRLKVQARPPSRGISRMEEVFINQEAEPYVIEADGTLDVAVLQLQPATVVINGKRGLVDVHTSKTKRTFAELQENVLHDATAGTMANPLRISGASLAGDDSAREQAGPFKKARTGVADLDRDEIAALINKTLPTASSYSKPTAGGWAGSRYKTLHPCMNFHRQDTLQDQRTTPVALLDPILAQVAEDSEVAAPTGGDCNFTVRVASAMSENFTKGSERMDKFWELLEDEYKVKFQRIEFGDAKTDGSLTHPKGGLMVNIEVKNEVGSGGGAVHVQNAAYAAKYAAGQAGRLSQFSTCPTLLIELAGPNMSFSGAVFSNVVVCDQLTPMVSLLWQPHSPLMLQAARCFAALRMALPRLCAYYDSVESQALGQQLEFPYPTSFIASDGGGRVHFQYVQRLSSLCFKGLIQPHGQSVFIKFCRSYSFAAHQAMAAAGYAPALLGFEQLLQGWLLVVQQFVDAVSWDEMVDKPVESLKAAVHALHAAGFVHGDLRGCNILVAAGAVSLIDFEWAGNVAKAHTHTS